MKRHVLVKISGLVAIFAAFCMAPHMMSSHPSSPMVELSSGDSWLAQLSGANVRVSDRANEALLAGSLSNLDEFDGFLRTFHLAATEPAFTCFSHGTPEEEAAILLKYPLLGNPPPPNPLAFFTGTSWTPVGEGLTLTWSLVPDGTFIPSFGTGAGASSDMFATFDAQFAAAGGRATWVSLVEQFLERWTELNGNTYVRITQAGVDWDDGAAFNTSPGSATRGDIRISGRSIDGGTGSNILAFNFFPTNADMVIDTDNNWANSANNFRFFRNVLMHEHGHGIGLFHLCSSNSNHLMEPFINTSFDGLQHDDVRAAQRQHGDPFEPDNTVAEATDLGIFNIGDSQIVGLVPSPNINFTDNLSIDDDSEEDWFQFTVTEETGVTILASPRGIAYDNSPQNGDGSCPGAPGIPINSTMASDLKLQLFNTAGFVCATGDNIGDVCATNVDCLPNDICIGGGANGLMCTSSLECPGGTCGATCGVPMAESDLAIGSEEVLSDVRLAVAGSYFIRVSGRVLDTADGQTQLYRLSVAVTDPPAALPPVAAVAPLNISKDRYISFDPSGNGSETVAIRVAVPGGGFKYVGNVQDQGASGFFAQLVNAPEFRVWPETVIHVRGCEFAPGNSYDVESTLDDIAFSTPFAAVTTSVPSPREYGDVIGVFNGIDWAAPDGLVTANDVLAVVLTFQLSPFAPHKARVDLVPQTANTIIAGDDILSVVLGFSSQPYPFGTDCSTGTCVPSCP